MPEKPLRYNLTDIGSYLTDYYSISESLPRDKFHKYLGDYQPYYQRTKDFAHYIPYGKEVVTAANIGEFAVSNFYLD